MLEISHASLLLATYADANGIIHDMTFRDCRISGPAVVFLASDNAIEGSNYGAPLEAVIWEIPATRTMMTGCLTAIRCRWIGCTFDRIGLAITSETLAALTRGQTQISSSTPSPARPAWYPADGYLGQR